MSAFRAMTTAEAPGYLARAGLVEAGEALALTELGGGVSSVVILAETPWRRMIIKQALPKLKVQADWPSRPDRSGVEVAAIQALATLLPAGAVPTVLHDDPERHCFVMTAAPANALNWKSELLAGNVEPAVAEQAGAILAGMHLRSAQDPALAEQFDDREFFHTLRVDPYLWQVTRVYPELRPPIEALVEVMLARRLALVHGDYSPKNMLVHRDLATHGAVGTRVLVLDFEVAHWGDPAFDIAFCLNHFLLKAVYRAPDSERYLDLARRFLAAYTPALALDPADLLPRSLLLQGALMLARIDGKSPVEYITEPGLQARVRRISRRLLAERPAGIDHTIGIVRTGLIDA